jgi:hypothetical protein
MPAPSWLAIGITVVTASAAAAAAVPPPSAPERIPQAPFRTLLPWCLDAGRWEIAAGLSYESGARPPFHTGDDALERRAWHASLVDVAYGVGPGAEVRVQTGLQGFEQDDGASAWGIEDAVLSFAHQVARRRVAVAWGFGVKLPNASDADLLGTDETDVRLSAAAGWRSARGGWAAEAGLGILGNPLEDATQDDVLVFGAAGWLALGAPAAPGPPPLLATFEAAGQAASRFGNDVARLSAGLTWMSVRFPVSVVVSRGLTDESEDWGVNLRATIPVSPYH